MKLGVRPQQKMRPSFHLSTSGLTLLSLTLLLPVPHAVTSYPHPPSALLPREYGSQLESTLLRLQAALDDPSNAWLMQPDAWAEWPTTSWLNLLESREGREEVVLRTQRGDPSARLLSPFPGGHSLESISYQDGGEADNGKRNQALTFIAGGLQAVSREKGGFGFRFGRK